ncbi:MAG: chromosome partitioning protein ParA [Lachnospiraceae bacterium]|nr:chromosome partitioning protein ParA [Lachnospiraceae bacterium]
MKIKVAILDHDENYKSRLVNNFQIKYADKLELYVFSTTESLEIHMKTSRLDVVLADETIPLEQDKFPQGTALVYLCKSTGIEELEGLPTICKFQKTDTIYKQILGIYAEHASHMKLSVHGSSARIVLFLSAQGGCGTSSAAAAYALRCAHNQKKVFYLNLELFGGADKYFSSDGIMSFSDVIYALKSRKSNLLIKMESSVKIDRSGVEFFDTCKNAYDMLELKDEEIDTLLQGIIQMKEYEDIIIDVSGDMDARKVMLMKAYASRIVCVSDGSMIGNQKFEHFCEVLGVAEQREGTSLIEKMVLLYNRYGSKTSSQLDQSAIPVLGGIHRYEGVAGRELIEEIAKQNVLEQI